MRAFRIAPVTRAGTRAEAFAGQGGLHAPGRWNSLGAPIVYTAQHLSLATLELLVHLQRNTALQPHVWYEVEIPDNAIGPPPPLPTDWSIDLRLTRSIGDAWLKARTTAALRVPSAVVPTEFNLLLNPLHPAFRVDWVQCGPTPVQFDPRLVSRPPTPAGAGSTAKR